MKKEWNEKALTDLVRVLVAQELPRGTSIPDDSIDLVKTGLLDSMGWVGILTGMEGALGIKNFGGAWPQGRPQSIHALINVARSALAAPKPEPAARSTLRPLGGSSREVSIAGWAYALGSTQIAAEGIDVACGLPPGTLRDHAGINSVCVAAEVENEITLAQKAARSALETAETEPDAIDSLVCASATFLELPSLGAILHSRLLLRDDCGVLDIGGGCVALVNALATAVSLLGNRQSRGALVVASEVNSRRLASPLVPGEFRGLFGDGACAFVLSAADSVRENASIIIGDIVLGCSAGLSSSLRVALPPGEEVSVDFEGEALAGGAVATLNEVIGKLERLSGVERSQVEAFALHEPNPRLTAILAQRANIPAGKIFRTAETCGNLGSVTCGVNLCAALSQLKEKPERPERQTVFLAAVGPGVLWGAAYLDRRR